MQRQNSDPVRSLLKILLVLSVVGLFFAAVLGTGKDPVSILSIFSTRLLGIFIEAAPFLLLGTLASGLIEVFVTPDDIARWVPRRRLPATLVGTLMGFTFPVCECGVVPVVRRLYHKGLPLSVGIAFLLAAPVMNPIVLVSTYSAFGFTPVFFGRIIITLAVAVVIGLIFASGARPLEVLRPGSLMPSRGGSDEPEFPEIAEKPRKPFIRSLTEALRLAREEFFEMGRYLALGSLLAAALQTFISQDLLLALGRGPVTSVIVMQVLAFLLSVGSTADAFVALAFTGTFTTGSILAFLTFGPMVDIKSAVMFTAVFRKKTVLYLIVLPLILTMWAGIWLNLNAAF